MSGENAAHLPHAPLIVFSVVTSEMQNDMCVCKICGHVQDVGDDPHPQCANCGGGAWKRTITIDVEDTLNISDELGAAARDQDGNLTAERIEKTDRNTSASLSSDRGKPSRIFVERQARVPNFVEEGRVAEAFTASYNKRCNTHYSVEPKPEEDSDYADRVLRSARDTPQKLNVQIRHLDAEIIADVGRQGKFSGERTVANLIDSIRESITAKAQIDQRLRAETILLLVIPAPLGIAIREGVESCQVDCQGFRDVWLAPFHEECIGLTHI